MVAEASAATNPRFKSNGLFFNPSRVRVDKDAHPAAKGVDQNVGFKARAQELPPVNFAAAGVRHLLDEADDMRIPSRSTMDASSSETSARKTCSTYSRSVHYPSRSNTSSSTSKFDMLDRESDRESTGKFEDRNAMTLLKASPPTPVSRIKDRYCVRIKRASLRQPFGLSFQATEGAVETRPSGCSGILISEDLPHLGVRKWDELVTINCRSPKTVDECRNILAESLSLVLVLQHREPGDVGDVDNGLGVSGAWSLWSWWNASSNGGDRESEPKPGPFRTLLSVTRADVLDESLGEFQLVIYRASLKQKFGVTFDVEHSIRKRGQMAMIVIAEDMPHFGLCQGDQLVSINSIPPASGTECRRILERSMSINLHLRRHPERLMSAGVAMVFAPTHERLQTIDDEAIEESALPHRDACTGCWSGPCA